MKILITGANGFIGKQISFKLQGDGHEVISLDRQLSQLKTHALDAEAVIHLAGEPIAGKRWTDDQKKAILESRTQGTTALIDGLKDAPNLQVFLSASAVGFYGDRGNEDLVENSPPPSSEQKSFLSQVCKEWENAALSLNDYSTARICLLRFGIVLGPDGGALHKMITPFKLGVGGPLGSGEQWMSWIHQNDVLNAIDHCLKAPQLEGPMNLTSPNPVTNQEFSKELAAVLDKNSFFSTPEFVLKLALGEMADEMLLSSQKVHPKKLLDSGFTFNFPDLKKALDNLFAH